MATETEIAFAKVNLCLYLGPTRGDGRHELVTLFESVSLADELTITPLGAGESDRVVCETVTGPNLVSGALAALRAAGWAAPAIEVQIAKRIPVAAGLGGGSADAAAMLRHAPRLAPVPDGLLWQIAAGLGADVPSQLEPGASLGTAAGEILEPVEVADHGLVVVPQAFALSTADVYREADRLGSPRCAEEIAELRDELREELRVPITAGAPLPERLMVNDLQPAALSLAPQIAETLELAERAGARPAMVCGSGPTVIGIFRGSQAPAEAAEAAAGLRGRHPGAVAVSPAGRGTGHGAPND